MLGQPTMLPQTSELRGYVIGAIDGPFGTIKDFLFDDEAWRVRWLVVDTRGFLDGRKVLLPALALRSLNHVGRQISANLTKWEMANSPSADDGLSISRRAHHDGPYVRGADGPRARYRAGGGFAAANREPPNRAFRTWDRAFETPRATPWGWDLRSVKEITGYHIAAADGEVGRVADFLVEDGDWSLHDVVIDARNGWRGKRVLISPRSIDSVDWSMRRVRVDFDRRRIQERPAYDRFHAIGRE
jgi:hypothetical protein